MRIEPIWRCRALIPVIARWHWDEWRHADPGGSLESWTVGLQERTCVNAIPTTYVAIADDGVAIGSVVLVANDMETHPELSPWLAGLYVSAAHRRGGVGSALARHAIDRCIEMGAERLYLHTSSATSLYERLGWKVLIRELYEGEQVDVMEYAV